MLHMLRYCFDPIFGMSTDKNINELPGGPAHRPSLLHPATENPVTGALGQVGSSVSITMHKSSSFSTNASCCDQGLELKIRHVHETCISKSLAAQVGLGSPGWVLWSGPLASSARD